MPAITGREQYRRWVERLILRIEGSARPILVVRGFAGSGKSTLLSMLSERYSIPIRRGGGLLHIQALTDAPITLVDCDEEAPTFLMGSQADDLIAAERRVIMACRPGEADGALDRQRAYGRVDIICPRDLFLRADDVAYLGQGATHALTRSGGWPWLFRHLLDGDAEESAIMRFVDREFLEPMDDGMQAVLAAVTSLRRGLRDCDLTRSDRDGLEDLRPLLRLDDSGRWCWAVPELASAIREAVDLRLRSSGSVKARADCAARLYAHGAVSDAIRIMQDAGNEEQAVAFLIQSGGAWFGHFFGGRAFARVLGGFGPAVSSSEVVGLSHVMQALKTGRVDRARWLLSDHFGEGALSLEAVLAPDSAFSTQMQVFRLVMATYEQSDPDETLVERAFHVLARLPEEDHLKRGLFYNAVIDFYLRQRRLSEARAVARRALVHYRAAGTPYLGFFIHLHETVICLMDGRPDDAQRSSEACAALLRESRIAAAADWRIYDLVHGCIDYERGDPEPLVRFIDQDMEPFSFGELWPTLGELCLQYGTLALAEATAPADAQAFLDRWRVELARSGRFRKAAVLNEIRLLQARHRWREAGRRLEGMTLTSFRNAELVSDRHELAALMVLLRQRTYEDPTDKVIVAALDSIVENPRLTARQGLAASYWRAFASMRGGRLGEARDRFALTLERAAQRQSIATALEERPFVKEMLANKRVAGQLKPSEQVQSLLRRLHTSRTDAASTDAETGITRREMRVLRLIAEGCSNKEAARAIGVSEATIKFHLSNSYRKLAAGGRREAVAIARSRGWCD